ncbi:MAG: PepSY domain-containing protein [Rhodospirillales bacterium]
MTGGARKALYRVHSWLGLNLGLLAFVLCLSGTVAVFGPELTWLTDPAYRVDPPPAAERKTLSWQKIHDSVRQAYPDGVIRRIAAPRGERWAARAMVHHGAGGLRVVLVDPYSGQVQGQRSTFNAQSFFRLFHKQFYIVPTVQGLHGILIVGPLGLVLLLSAVTGLLSIKRWWRALVRLRADQGCRVLWSDLHRFAGTWSLVVAVVLAVTGIWYLAEWGLHKAEVLTEDAKPTRLSASALNSLPPSPKALDLDQLQALVWRAYPQLDIAAVTLPRRLADPVIFQGQAEAWLVRARANQVHMNPYTGDILTIRRATDLDAFDRWVETADPLHFGIWGGLATRIIWLITGLLLSGGILAGMYGMWLRRRANQRSRPRPWTALAAILPTVAVIAAAIQGTLAYGLAQQHRAQIMSETLAPVPDLAPGFILLIILFGILSIWPAAFWVRLRLRA